MNWEEMSKVWIELSDQIEATLRPVHDRMMERAALGPGERVIDIGFGTGDTVLDAADVVGPGGAVLGLDIAPPMVAHLRERLGEAKGAPVTLREGDAEVFAFEPGAADAVISKFGLMFFGDTGAAFCNIRKGLRPGGRMVFAAWGAARDNPCFTIPRAAAVERLGAPPPPDPDAPGPVRFAEAGRVLDLLHAAGWEAEVETCDLTLTPLGTPEELALAQLRFGPASLLIREKNASEADKAAIVAALSESYAALQVGGSVRIPAKIHFFSARVPG